MHMHILHEIWSKKLFLPKLFKKRKKLAVKENLMKQPLSLGIHNLG